MFLEVLAWGAVPLIGFCVVAGVRSRFRAAEDARLSRLRSLGSIAESSRRQQNETIQQAMREARRNGILKV